eukprot:224513-Lingulodinium_polyedra.AAC.1
METVRPWPKLLGSCQRAWPRCRAGNVCWPRATLKILDDHGFARDPNPQDRFSGHDAETPPVSCARNG